jgi:hypothetical protein
VVGSVIVASSPNYSKHTVVDGGSVCWVDDSWRVRHAGQAHSCIQQCVGRLTRHGITAAVCGLPQAHIWDNKKQVYLHMHIADYYMQHCVLLLSQHVRYTCASLCLQAHIWDNKKQVYLGGFDAVN